MKILTAAEMREVDRQTALRFGVSALELMENAGSRMAEFLAARFPNFVRRRIVVLCGKGNNGGDGFVAARKLREKGAQPLLILCAATEDVSGDAAINLQRWSASGGEIQQGRTLDEWNAAKQNLAAADFVLDALLGTGLRGPAEGVYAAAIEDINLHGPNTVVISVDIPSGLSADSGEIPGPAVVADFTVTLSAPKLGLVMAPAADHVGRLRVAHIGSPPGLIEATGIGNLRWLEPGEFHSLPTRRKANSNKGDYGHALIIAGSRGKTGAAAMAAWAALRSGAGLVTIATAETEQRLVAASVPEVMTEPLEATEAGTISLRSFEYERLAKLQTGKTVLALGPGLSTNQETQQFIRRVMQDTPLPLILDADGLNAFAGRADEMKRRRSPGVALTPHPGEMGRLMGCSNKDVQGRRLEIATHAASDWNVTVILKGQGTILATPNGSAWINSTGNPGMATGGTGDVLTGILAGLTAQFGHASWPVALGFGIYLHGLAGDLAAAEFGEAPLMASDLIRALPRAYAQTLAGIRRE